MGLHEDARAIIDCAIEACQPDEAVSRALKGRSFPGDVVLISVGKAAWNMARAALETLGGQVTRGLVITKYGHCRGALSPLELREAGHPVPDENSFSAAERALELVSGLTARDTVLLLVSGGGSALFELPLIPPQELRELTSALLASGADINEMNAVRKRLSAVKGGRFALACAPAEVLCVLLSDVVGGTPDVIASGPACPDRSTCAEALAVAEKYGLKLSENARSLLGRETPKTLPNAETTVSGGVGELCAAAVKKSRALGYDTLLLTDCLCCEAREAGRFLAAVARSHAGTDKPLCFIAGGETVVRLTGKGVGGRNQELSLAAAAELDGLDNALVFSVGSDGTDGPTDAAGGVADGETLAKLKKCGIDIDKALADNDSYTALSACGGLIVTGPTGTNVNDLCGVLVVPKTAQKSKIG